MDAPNAFTACPESPVPNRGLSPLPSLSGLTDRKPYRRHPCLDVRRFFLWGEVYASRGNGFLLPASRQAI